MYRLPGPSTISSASAIAARASSEARTSAGVDPRPRRCRAVCVISDWPSTTVPSRRPGVEDQRRRGGRHDLAADGEDAVHPADALLEVAALERGHRGEQEVARRRGRRAVRPPRGASVRRAVREAVLRGAAPMSGSASARAAMQLRMSPTGGIPSSSRRTPDEPPSSATVTIAVRLLVCSLRPRRSVDRPVPPPIATTRGPRARNRRW